MTRVNEGLSSGRLLRIDIAPVVELYSPGRHRLEPNEAENRTDVKKNKQTKKQQQKQNKTKRAQNNKNDLH